MKPVHVLKINPYTVVYISLKLYNSSQLYPYYQRFIIPILSKLLSSKYTCDEV